MSVSKDELRAAALAIKEGTPAREIIHAGAEWARRRSDGISVLDVLVRRQVLSQQKRRAIERELGRDDPSVLDEMTRDEVPMDSLTHGETELRTEPGAAGALEDSLGNDENVGTEARGRYEPRIDEKGLPLLLGKGGIGRVFLVFDRFVGREVALKELAVPPPHEVHDTTSTTANEARFLREARVTGQLEHPAIVPVYELARRKEGALYYSMRRVRGRNLHQSIREAKTLEGRLDLLPHFMAMCQALAYAHSRAVIHRDVKPQNVMIGQFGETYLLDWGLARVKGRPDPRKEELRLAPDITGDSLGGAIGTPAYMSPEQARGQVEIIDEKSDVFGLGAVLYEIVGGRPPYLGPSPAEVVDRVRQGPPDPVLKLEPQAPRELVDIVERAMSRAPEDRYESANALAKDVEAWRAGRRVSAHAYSSWELLRGFTKKNRIAIGITATALVTMVTLAAVSAWQLREEADTARKFAQFYLDDVSPTLAQLPNATELVRTLTQRTFDHYQRTVDPRSGPYSDRLRMAQALVRLGRLSYSVQSLDDARKAFDRGRELLELLVRETETDHGPSAAMAEAVVGLGDVATDQDHEGDAELRYAAAVEFARKAERLAPQDREVLDTLSRALSRLGNLQAAQGRLTAARPLLEAAVLSDEKFFKLFPDLPRAQASFSLTLGYLGGLKADLGQFDESERYHRRALELSEHALLANPDDYRAAETRVLVLYALAELSLRRGQGPHATELLSRCAALGEQQLALNPENADVGFATTHCELMLGDVAGAARVAEKVRAKAAPAEWEPTWLQLDLLRGAWPSVVKAVPSVTRSNRPLALIQGAIAAALMGDAATAKGFATEAEQLIPTSKVAWWANSAPQVGQLEGKNTAAVGALVAAIDRAYSGAHLEAVQEALRAFVTAL